jgi:hypothetical protein
MKFTGRGGVLQVPQTGRQVVIDLPFAQLPFEIPQLRPGIDEGQFNAGNAGQIFQVLRGHRITVTGVVRAPGVDPGRARGLEIRQAFPERAGHRQPGAGVAGA